MHDQRQKLDLQLCLPVARLSVTCRNRGPSLGRGTERGDQRGAISGDAIYTHAKQKLRVLLLRQAEQLINVALAVSNVKASLRLSQKSRGVL